MLIDVTEPAIQRLVRLQLAETYLAAGRKDKALDEYRKLTAAGPAK